MTLDQLRRICERKDGILLSLPRSVTRHKTRLMSSRGPLGAVINLQPLDGRDVVRFDCRKVIAWLDRIEHDIELASMDEAFTTVMQPSGQAAELK